MHTLGASSARSLASWLVTASCVVAAAGCYSSTEVRRDRLLDEGHAFVVGTGERAVVQMHDRSLLTIEGPARLHRRGNELRVVDAHSAFSVRADDVARTTVRGLDSAETIGLVVGLVAMSLTAVIALAASAANDDRSARSPRFSDRDALGLAFILALAGGG